MDRLSDAEWERIGHLFSNTGIKKMTGRPAADSRAVMDAILWIERTGERWLYLPAHFPPQQTCYTRYLQWKRNGTLDQVHALLADTAWRAGFDPGAGGCVGTI
ncbi:transposase [Paraburkholderia caffeinilytica]|uniref:transposase n=1 Tax=Paraburkholderia caffeinilytica TaxID=1761016 RepID=UPI003DA089D4